MQVAPLNYGYNNYNKYADTNIHFYLLVASILIM